MARGVFSKLSLGTASGRRHSERRKDQKHTPSTVSKNR